MDIFEELELPPWEKFRRYGLFPYKMTLHITLTTLITVLVIIINLSFASYSRSVWLSAVNILYPQDYTNYQTDMLSPYQYYIYTQNRTIIDSNSMISKYFNLRDESVNDVYVYENSEQTNGLDAPTVVVKLTTGEVTYPLTNGPDSFWPLSIHNLDSINVRQFFNDFKSMTFNFYLQSYGNSDDYSYEKNLCFTWKWKFLYDFHSNGQILVTGQAQVLNRCQKIPSNSVIYGFSVIIFILSIWYQILLLKAVTRQLIILYNIKTSLNWLETKSNPSRSRQTSVDPNSANTHQKSRSAAYSSVGQGSQGLNPLLDLSAGQGSPGGINDNDPDNDGEDEDEEEKEGNEIATLIRSRLHELQISKSIGDRSRSQLHEKLNAFSTRNSFRRTNSVSSTHSRMSQIEEKIAVFQEAIRSLSWEDVFIIINIWFLVSSIGNLFALIYSACIVISGEDTIATAFLKGGLGLSCLMYWFSLVQYLEFFPRYYIMISMLKITVPRVSQFLLGVLPIFIGYALLGMICFGDVSDQFANISETLRTLFSVVNGDIIYDTFREIDFAGFGGQIYIYIYILIFTYVVLMTIIAIVEEAFFESQERKGITNSTFEDSDLNSPNDDGNNNGSKKDPTGVVDLAHSRERRMNISSQTSTINQFLTNQLKKSHEYQQVLSQIDEDELGEDSNRNTMSSLHHQPIDRNSSSLRPSDGLSQTNFPPDYSSSHSNLNNLPGSNKGLIPDEDDQNLSFHSSASVSRQERISRADSRASSTDQGVTLLSANNLQAITTAVKRQNTLNENAPIGKRDVPEHLRVLLQNAEKRVSRTNSTQQIPVTNPTANNNNPATTTTTSSSNNTNNNNNNNNTNLLPRLPSLGYPKP